MIPRDLWIENVIDSLKEIASEEFQRKGWIEGKVHQYCTFVETICSLYQDSHFEFFIDKKAKEFGFTKYQIKKLDVLRKALNKYVKKHGCYEEPEKIIKDPKWQSIVKMAQEALQALGIEKFLEPSMEVSRKSLLYRIWWLVDEKILRKGWDNRIDPNKDPLQELLNEFFEVCKAKEIIENYRDYEITEGQRSLLIQLYDALNAYGKEVSNGNDLQKILKDPKWIEIQKIAADTLEEFKFKMHEE